MDLVTLTTKEVRRLEVLQTLGAGTLHQAEAATALHLSVRQVKRLWRGPFLIRAQGTSARCANRTREGVGRPLSCPHRKKDPATVVTPITPLEESIFNLMQGFVAILVPGAPQTHSKPCFTKKWDGVRGTNNG